MLISGVSTRNVTAVLPHVGPVTWAKGALDEQATEWMREHAPVGAAWQIPWVKPRDVRVCAGCPRGIAWQECQYALWARLWAALRRSQGESISDS